MILTKDLINKKVTMKGWDPSSYFIPLAVTTTGSYVGETRFGDGYVAQKLVSEKDIWEFYEETESVAPALMKFSNGLFSLSLFFRSEVDAKESLGQSFVCWPASIEISDDKTIPLIFNVPK